MSFRWHIALCVSLYLASHDDGTCCFVGGSEVLEGLLGILYSAMSSSTPPPRVTRRPRLKRHQETTSEESRGDHAEELP
jgi:hypothetical protein